MRWLGKKRTVDDNIILMYYFLYFNFHYNNNEWLKRQWKATFSVKDVQYVTYTCSCLLHVIDDNIPCASFFIRDLINIVIFLHEMLSLYFRGTLSVTHSNEVPRRRWSKKRKWERRVELMKLRVNWKQDWTFSWQRRSFSSLLSISSSSE